MGKTKFQGVLLWSVGPIGVSVGSAAAEGPLWQSALGRAGGGWGRRVMWRITYIPALYKALYLFACCWLVEGVRDSVPGSGLSARPTPRSEAGPRACTGAQANLGILTCP